MSDVSYNKEKFEGYKLGIQEILGVLNLQSSALDESPSVFQSATYLAPDASGDIATSLVAKNGTPSAPSLIFHVTLLIPNSVVFLNFNIQVCQRLVERAFGPHELSSLIEAVFSDTDEHIVIRGLDGDSAQKFIDVIDEVRSVLSFHRGTWLVETKLTYFVN